MKKLLLILLFLPTVLSAQNLRKWSSDSTTNILWGDYFYRLHPLYADEDSLKLVDFKLLKDTAIALREAIGGSALGYVILTASSSGDDMKVYNTQTSAGFSSGVFYPNTGTNVTSTIVAIPKGTGTSGNKSGINIYETDAIADGINTSFFGVTATGTSFDITTMKTGTGTLRPLKLYTQGNADQFTLATDGSVAASGPFSAQFLTAKGGAIQVWKDATPTAAANIGMSVPGNSTTDDLIFSTYNGVSWAGKLTLTNAGSLLLESIRTSGLTPTPTGTLKPLKTDQNGLFNFGDINLTNEVTGALPVANGGTGNSSLTAYGVMLAGTTSTGAMQQVSGLGTAGQVLKSNGAGAAPSWEDESGGSDLHLVNDADYTVASSVSAVRYLQEITDIRTLTLPDASSYPKREIWVKTGAMTVSFGQLTIVSASNIYLDGASGSTSQPVNIPQSVFLFKSDGTSWYKIN